MDNSPFHSDKLITNSCYCVMYYSFGDSGIGSIVITQLNFSLLESLVCILFSSILSMSGWLLFFYVQTFFIPSGTVTAYAGKVVRLEKFLQETYQEVQQNFCDGLFAFSKRRMQHVIDVISNYCQIHKNERNSMQFQFMLQYIKSLWCDDR